MELVSLGGGQVSLESTKKEAEDFEEELEDYTDFKKDIHGRPLRYKVLVRDLAIKQILYNTGNSVEKIPFEEFRIRTGQLYTINNDNFCGANTVFGYVTNIPVRMIACEENQSVVRDSLEEGQCENDSLSQCTLRYFDRLPGHVDFEIVTGDCF